MAKTHAISHSVTIIKVEPRRKLYKGNPRARREDAKTSPGRRGSQYVILVIVCGCGQRCTVPVTPLFPAHCPAPHPPMLDLQGPHTVMQLPSPSLPFVCILLALFSARGINGYLLCKRKCLKLDVFLPASRVPCFFFRFFFSFLFHLGWFRVSAQFWTMPGMGTRLV